MKIAMPALIVLLMAVVCCDGRNEYQEAHDHVLECLGTHPGDNGEPEPAFDTCEQNLVCIARCDNNADCDVIRDAFGEIKTDASKTLRDCIASCGSL